MFQETSFDYTLLRTLWKGLICIPFESLGKGPNLLLLQVRNYPDQLEYRANTRPGAPRKKTNRFSVPHLKPTSEIKTGVTFPEHKF